MIGTYRNIFLLLILFAVSEISIACTISPKKQGYNFSEKLAISDNIFVINFDSDGKNVIFRLIEVLRGDKKELAKIPILLTKTETGHSPIHGDLPFWLGKKSNSIVTSDCKIHFPFRIGGAYLLMAKGQELISLEPIEPSKDEWANFVRKNVRLRGKMEIPENVFYKSIKSKIRVSCTNQENPVLSVFSRLTLAKYCKGSVKEYLLLTAEGLDVFLPIENGTVFLARQKSDLRLRVGFGDGAKNNDIFRGYILSRQK